VSGTGRPDLDWIPSGTVFGAGEMLFHRDLPERPLDEILADVDLIVTGPHASAAFPEEVAPWIDARLTRRLQRDFTDLSTSPMARRWVQLDPHVLYIENPHPRAVRDANRARPADLGETLREAFQRIREAGESSPKLSGVDAIRPVTFGLRPVLIEPADDAGWAAMIGAFATAGANGVDAYEALRDRVIDRAIEVKLRRLAQIDPASVTAADWRGATTLLTLSLHDTMNHTAAPNGAIDRERLPQDRLPNVVALSNRGDHNADPRASADGSMLAPIDVPSCRPRTARALAQAQRAAFSAAEPGDVVFNAPYLGGYETQVAGVRLREIEPCAVVRTPDGGQARLELGAFQFEYLREFLLGPEATAALMAPGTDWPEIAPDHVDRIARGMAHAHDHFRRWGQDLVGS